MEYISASAPAKCIITGEHSVVYGAPALVVALDMRALVKVRLIEEKNIIIDATQFNKKVSLPLDYDNAKKIDNDIQPIYISAIKTMEYIDQKHGLSIIVDSEIPPSSGLGSSAAVSVATVKAVSKIFGSLLVDEEIIKLSLESEKFVHGTPSGIDNAISVNGGGIIYQKGKITKIENLNEIPLVIGDTLKSRNTGILVAKVRENYNKYPEIFKKIIETIGEITINARKAFENNCIKELGELMNINQQLLITMGVSTRELEKLIDIANKNGAYGAKLTGAGGGGCMIAITEKTNRENIAKEINKAGGKSYITKISLEGVKIEK